MNNRLLLTGLGILAILVLVVGAYFFFNSQQTPTGASDAEPTETITQESNELTQEPTNAMTTEKVQVELTSSGFSPKTITVDKDTTVVWTNNSGKAATVDSAPHPVHSDYSKLNLGSFNDGETLELIFNETGTFKYHNHLNPSQNGSVIVK